ncbi:hypothetical protein J3458_005883 [Metarhizium acridum]|uniref:uncharacterized protein n=1 Tax=Metarhizium acridum TaxID=92637 RepID=UPI001C6CA8F6|nr:hypothetical protein J3458_005883 [Metarhizium acridum]
MERFATVRARKICRMKSHITRVSFSRRKKRFQRDKKASPQVECATGSADSTLCAIQSQPGFPTRTRLWNSRAFLERLPVYQIRRDIFIFRRNGDVQRELRGQIGTVAQNPDPEVLKKIVRDKNSHSNHRLVSQRITSHKVGMDKRDRNRSLEEPPSLGALALHIV